MTEVQYESILRDYFETRDIDVELTSYSQVKLLCTPSTVEKFKRDKDVTFYANERVVEIFVDGVVVESRKTFDYSAEALAEVYYSFACRN